MCSDPPKPGQISLVVAIVGYSDLCEDDLTTLRKELGIIFEDLHCKKNYPCTPILLLNGLGEGAERIAAETARNFSVNYVPVRLSTSVGAGRNNGNEVAIPVDPDTPHHRQLEQLGEFLVRNSQILIAIWDQRQTHEPGSPSEVIKLKLAEKRPPSRVPFTGLNDGGAGPVYIILTRGHSTDKVKPLGQSRDQKYPPSQGEKAEEDYHSVYCRLDQYNANLEKHRNDLKASAEQSRKWLLEGVDSCHITPGMKWIADTFCWADALAQYYQRWNSLLRIGIFAVLGIAGVLLTLLHTREGGWSVFYLYTLCLLLAFLMGKWETLSKHRDRHEDYRALAEALRVQFFWFVAGLPDLASDHYLFKQATEMAWIRDAISECGLYDEALKRTTALADSASRLAYAQKWVQGQVRFFKKAIDRNTLSKKIFDGCAYSAVAIALIFLVLGLAKSELPGVHLVPGIAMWGAALSWNFSERRGFLQDARRYIPMWILFRSADAQLTQLLASGTDESLRHAEKIIQELGREALRENGEWLATHRELKLNANLAAG
jgi:hypothetical protein